MVIAEVAEVKEYSPEVLHAINALLPQLSRSAETLGVPELEKIIRSDSVHLLVAQEGSSYFGTLSLVVFPTISGNRAWIEDVVVSETVRGKGVGKFLIEKALEIASMHGVKTVDLTSRSSREAANRLYQTVGFEKRETNVYRVLTKAW